KDLAAISRLRILGGDRQNVRGRRNPAYLHDSLRRSTSGRAYRRLVDRRQVEETAGASENRAASATENELNELTNLFTLQRESYFCARTSAACGAAAGKSAASTSASPSSMICKLLLSSSSLMI